MESTGYQNFNGFLTKSNFNLLNKMNKYFYSWNHRRSD